MGLPPYTFMDLSDRTGNIEKEDLNTWVTFSKFSPVILFNLCFKFYFVQAHGRHASFCCYYFTARPPLSSGPATSYILGPLDQSFFAPMSSIFKILLLGWGDGSVGERELAV